MSLVDSGFPEDYTLSLVGQWLLLFTYFNLTKNLNKIKKINKNTRKGM